MAADVATQIMTARAEESVAESPFYIPMTGPAARPRRSLKHDDTFIVLDSHGDIGASAGGPDGLFNRDTRYLARLELLLDDLQPLLLGSNLRDDNSVLTVDLTNPDIYRDGRIVLQKDMLHIVRTIFLWRGTASRRIGLQNHGDRPASLDLTLLFDNDFADLFEVRGERRPHRGVGSGKLLGPADVMLEYNGLDDKWRGTALHFDPRPTRLSVNAATYHLDLAPRQVGSLFVAASCNKPATFKPARFFRGCEMAALREVPFAQYYGGVDATPLFVLLAGLYVERTGDEETLAELWPSIEAALGWINGPGDPDRDGFVEYRRASEQGLANQGWKDSYDAIFHADGRLAEGYIALAEVQGYVYAAKRLAARCASRLGNSEMAQALEIEAGQLAERFEEAFWCDELGTYALALDGAKEPCRVRTSNAGQLLFSGMVRADRARLVSAALMRPHFFAGWGIRTVASGEARYNPTSYHNGSVWPHDNAPIALGLPRHGLKHSVAHLFKALFDAATYMDLRRLPELFLGFRRERRRGPTLYPVACAPQAWASATPFTLLEAALGLEFDAQRGEIRLRNPRLPAFLNEVVIRDLQLGPSSVDLVVRRHGDEVSLEVLRTRGQIQVSIVLAH